MTLDCTCTRLKEAEAKAAKWDGIVRCQDCKYVNPKKTRTIANAVFLWCKIFELPFLEDWYCAWGERREDA